MFCHHAAVQPGHCQLYGTCQDYCSSEPYGLCLYEKETRWILTMQRAGIGKRYWDIEFDSLSDTIRETEVYQKARHYADHLSEALRTGLGWWLFGKNGVGKTSLLLCIVKSALRQGYSGLCVEVPELSSILGRKRMKKDEAETDPPLEDRIFHDDFLLLDDLGAEGEDPIVMACIQRVVLRRVNEMKPMLIACDLEPGVILSRWKKAGLNRIVDRLQAVSVISILKGRNLRKGVALC